MKDVFLKVFWSATKIVFVIIALALVWFTATWIVDGKDFFTIVAMVFTAYYSKNKTWSDSE